MPRVLRVEGPLTNVEVLNYINTTRARHAAEDSTSKSTSKTPAQNRPSNFLSSLEKHSRHLSSPAYHYTRNPTAYSSDAAHIAATKKFLELHMQRIQKPLADSYIDRVRKGEVGAEQARKELEREHERKELTETEVLMVVNHAPQVVEVLQPMIEGWAERFTGEEMELLVEIVGEVFRCDEMKIAG